MSILRVKKTLELLSRKYYLPKTTTDVEKYVHGFAIQMSNKAQRYQLYYCMQALPDFTHNYKNLKIDFVTGLPRSRHWRGIEYDSIFIIFG